MYNKESTFADLKLALEDINKALEKRPNDKFYKQHRQELDTVINTKLNSEGKFVMEMVERAEYAVQMKLKMQKRRSMEETKGERKVGPEEDDSDLTIEYPEECKVLDIMKGKYYDAIQFF